MAGGGPKSQSAGSGSPNGGAATAPIPPTLVLDNGANTIKAGLVTAGTSSSQQQKPRVIPNCIVRDRHKRVYVGSEFEAKCKDFGEIAYRRPVEKGYIVNWEAQKEIWDRELFNDSPSSLKIDPSETRLILAEQPNSLPALQNHCDQMVFEQFGFASYYRGIGVSSSSSSPLRLFPTFPLSSFSPTMNLSVAIVNLTLIGKKKRPSIQRLPRRPSHLQLAPRPRNPRQLPRRGLVANRFGILSHNRNSHHRRPPPPTGNPTSRRRRTPPHQPTYPFDLPPPFRHARRALRRE